MSSVVRSLSVVFLLVVAACSSGPADVVAEQDLAPETTLQSDAPETTPDAAPPAEPDDESGEADEGEEPPAEDSAAGAIDWTACGSVECGTFDAPLDHDDPDGETIEIALRRVPSSNPDPVGSLFINFGGPSAESTEIFDFAGQFFASVFGDEFHVVVWDPRGTGATARLACDDRGVDDVGVGIIDTSDGLDDELATEEASFGIIADCASATGPIIDNLSTVDVVKDLDLLRQAVGDEGLNYLGYSYGTQIGWVYATLFPDNVRALILDGAVPPGSLSRQGLIEQYAGFERTFAAFEEECDGSAACSSSDEGLGVRVDRIVNELRVEPIDLGDGSVFDADDFLEGVLTSLYSDVSFALPALDANIADVDDGDPSGFVSAEESNADTSTPAIYKAVNCADGFDITSEQDSIDYMNDISAAAPRFGQLNEGIRCDLWPGEIVGLPELDSTGAPTILVVGNTLDPATPYESAEELDQLLTDSVLLTYEGTGHTIVAGEPCIDAFAIDYLVNLVPPPPGTTC